MSGDLLPPVVAALKADIADFKAKMHEARSEADTAGKGIRSGLSTAGKVAGVALAGAGTAAVAFGASAVKAALEGERVTAQLATAVTNAGVSFGSVQGDVDKLSGKMARYGYENDEVEAALTRLVQSTGNVSGSMQNMALVADIAKARHMSLTDAATLVGKVMNGNVGALKRMGIATKDAAGNALTGADALKMLAGRFGGAAQADANTYAGKMAAFSATMANLKEEVGARLLPVLAKGAQVLAGVVDWFERHRAVAVALGVAVGTVLVAAVIAYTASMVSAAVATIAATWPIIAIAAAVAALVAAVVLLWTNWDQVWNWIMHHKALAAVVALLFPPVAALIAIVGAAKLLAQHWDQVWNGAKAVVTAAWSVIGPQIRAISDTVQSVVKIVSALLKGDFSGAWDAARQMVSRVVGSIMAAIRSIPTALAGLGAALWAGFRAAWNYVADRFKITLPKIDWGPIHLGGGEIGLPHLAGGGTIAQGGLAVVGEHGREVVALPAGATVYPNGAAPPATTTTQEFHFHQVMVTPAEIRREMEWAMLTAAL